MRTVPSTRIRTAGIVTPEERGDKPAMRELRVRVEADYVARLHALRFLRNKPMQQAVQEALDLYFAQLDAR